MELFVGIDVAFAKRKRLPVCICYWNGNCLTPLSTRDPTLPDVPRGDGNKASVNPLIVSLFAENVAQYLQSVEHHFGVRIKTIAIDAPQTFRSENQKRRDSERAL